LAAVQIVVMVTVGDQPCRPVARAADAAGHVRDRVDEREQLGDIAVIRRRRGPGERDAVAVDQYVVLYTSTAAIDRTRPETRTAVLGLQWPRRVRDHRLPPASGGQPVHRFMRAVAACARCERLPAIAFRIEEVLRLQPVPAR
jgi:hypothetical protein